MMKSQENKLDKHLDIIGRLIEHLFIIIIISFVLFYVMPVLISIVLQFFKLVIVGDTSLSIFIRDFKFICIYPVHIWYTGAFEWLLALKARLTS